MIAKLSQGPALLSGAMLGLFSENQIITHPPTEVLLFYTLLDSDYSEIKQIKQTKHT